MFVVKKTLIRYTVESSFVAFMGNPQTYNKFISPHMYHKILFNIYKNCSDYAIPMKWHPHEPGKFLTTYEYWPQWIKKWFQQRFYNIYYMIKFEISFYNFISKKKIDRVGRHVKGK